MLYKCTELFSNYLITNKLGVEDYNSIKRELRELINITLEKNNISLINYSIFSFSLVDQNVFIHFSKRNFYLQICLTQG